MWKTVAVLLFFCLSDLPAQQNKGRCNGDPPDSSWLVRGPVYQDCEVDRKVEKLGNDPRSTFSPPGGGLPTKECYRATFDFVVDTTGVPELETLRPHRGNDRDMEEAVRMTIASLHYRPAQREGASVRQVTSYGQMIVVRVQIATASGTPIGSARPRPTRC